MRFRISFASFWTDPIFYPRPRFFFMTHDTQDSSAAPLVGIIMGSRSDWPHMQHAAETLRTLQIPFEATVVSAHRTPDRLYAYAREAAGRGLRTIIAGAGGAAHLPGMLAAMTPLPVLGVPMPSAALNGVDSLLSIVQMPAGIPVATFAIGKPGAINAALFAAAMLGLTDPKAMENLAAFRDRQTHTVLENVHLQLDDEQ